MEEKNIVLLEKLLGAKVNVQESEKSIAKKEQELFVTIISNWEYIYIRNKKLFDEFRIETTEYENIHFLVIESLSYLCFGELETDIICWYIYDRRLPNGEFQVLVDNSGKKHTIKTPIQLYKFLKKLK